MQTNSKTKGLAVFSEEEKIRERSLRLYTYLVCHAFLRNKPNAFGDNVRIFQQRDLNLSEIKRVLGFDPETTKKYLNGLEEEGLVKFCPRGWEEKIWTLDVNEKGEEFNQKVPFKERWKIRNKHKDTYYEIPQPPLFRKIPKETLLDLNEYHHINELTMKIYILLINFQETCCYEGWNNMKFTYLDLRELLGYTCKVEINRKIEDCLNTLMSLNLIKLEKGTFINEHGVEIKCFNLKQVNFYIDYEIKGYETDDQAIISKDKKEIMHKYLTENYPSAFKS